MVMEVKKNEREPGPDFHRKERKAMLRYINITHREINEHHATATGTRSRTQPSRSGAPVHGHLRTIGAST